MTTKPKGRPAKPDMRTYQVRMTEAQHAEFKRLGGSAWLQKAMDQTDCQLAYSFTMPKKVNWIRKIQG